MSSEKSASVCNCGINCSCLLESSVADELSRLLKALGHPVRVQMIHVLARMEGRVCVCEIEELFDIKQPTISHHLRILKEANLVDAEQRGLYMYYRIVPETFARLQRHLMPFCV